RLRILIAFPLVFLVLLALHFPYLRLPYYWDEAGYYIPAAFDFFRHGLLIPKSTLPTGHTPLVMVYVGIVWRLFGFSELATRAAMVLVASAAVLVTYALGRRVASRETGIWAAALLALSPLFYAQSSLVFLDLTAALFTTLALLCVLEGRWKTFAAAASLAVLSKETAVVLLLAIWLYLWFRRKESRRRVWAYSVLPVIPLAAWAVFYHSRTGFWTGNATYLQYNLYSAITPLHILRSLIARLGEVFFQGFNWLVVLGAAAGIRYSRKRGDDVEGAARGDFLFLALALIAVYVLMLSVVGGAILPRYMLPVFPVFYVLAVSYIQKLPRRSARALCLVVVACFALAWRINPPYPFPYEDNVSYADFIRLHQRAAHYLESLPGNPVILTAWPATDELKTPFLGYVSRPLPVAAVTDFARGSFSKPPRFDVLYLYSRQWSPRWNLLTAFGPFRTFRQRFYDAPPQADPAKLAARFHLEFLQEFTSRGQWVRLYASERFVSALAGTEISSKTAHSVGAGPAARTLNSDAPR
ncbi:MAG: glycosyltransferase family 39 protein, partial [Acidobacteriota bacterium]|nr:glycosyltransferase family 39 protein [Acidobacteriota bacterium]